MHQPTRIGIGAEAAALPVAIGDVVDDKYRVESVLAVGGMGVVVRATHIALQRSVALKFVLPSLVKSREVRQRLMLEARAAARLRSEHVARVLDVGEHEGSMPFIVLEYLEGQDLAAKLDAGPLPVDVAVAWMLQVCDALTEAHAAGIVHRDLKPENVFVTTTANGSPLMKVLDFGISKLLAPDAEAPTVFDRPALLGSPMYMSPEQMLAPASVDARTDVWALGVLLYELIAGESPFFAQTLPGVCALVLEAAPVRLRQRVPTVPPGLEAAVHRCLSKQREARFSSVDELSRAIAPYASGRERAQRSAGTPAATAASLAPTALDRRSDGDEAPAPIEIDDPAVVRLERRLRNGNKWARRVLGALATSAIAAVVAAMAMQRIGPADLLAFAERIEALGRTHAPRAETPVATSQRPAGDPQPAPATNMDPPPAIVTPPPAPVASVPAAPSSAKPAKAPAPRAKEEGRAKKSPPARKPPVVEQPPPEAPTAAPEPEPYEEPGSSAPPAASDDGVYDARF